MTNDYIEASPEEVKLQATEFDSEISSMTRSNNFTEVSLGEKRRKIPKRILHFSDGQLEEYSSDDDDEFDSIKDQKPLINPKTLPWFPYLWYLTWWLGSRTLAVCDYLGEHLAYFFGITSPKYYYELQEYKRMIEEGRATISANFSKARFRWLPISPRQVGHHCTSSLHLEQII
ncbi:protein FAM177A1 isoform X2 [Centruroides vittatus]|uniref:protein FAM177A1 isoform X2 n=1 Tax=Centruroides vittatus TaxID=120091 RepID=UPI00351024F9